MKRYITYDASNSKTYDRLYEYFEEINANPITESTYLVNDNRTWDSFKEKIRSLITNEDKVYIIYNSVNGISHIRIEK